jgi:hypothetical protein
MPVRRIKRLFILMLCLTGTVIRAQDSVLVPKYLPKDTLVTAGSNSSSDANDTVAVRSLDQFTFRYNPNRVYGDAIGYFMEADTLFKLSARAVNFKREDRPSPHTDWIFYLFLFCFSYLGVIRLIFSRYLEDLFRVFFNVVLRQKHIRDQLAQKSLPSLLLNVFFVLSAGLFLFFMTRGLNFAPDHQPWQLASFFILLLAAVYLAKYMLVRFAGWITGKNIESENYIFIVFMVNKIVGLFLLPMSVLLAYTEPANRLFYTTLSLAVLSILIVIRLVRVFDYVHKEFRINLLHFIVFVFSFEVLPILLLDKALRDFLLQ